MLITLTDEIVTAALSVASRNFPLSFGKFDAGARSLLQGTLRFVSSRDPREGRRARIYTVRGQGSSSSETAGDRFPRPEKPGTARRYATVNGNLFSVRCSPANGINRAVARRINPFGRPVK